VDGNCGSECGSAYRESRSVGDGHEWGLGEGTGAGYCGCESGVCVLFVVEG